MPKSARFVRKFENSFCLDLDLLAGDLLGGWQGDLQFGPFS
jgi:hypothetical protein